MKIHRAEQSLRRTLTLIPLILGSSIGLLSCNPASVFPTSTFTYIDTSTASPAVRSSPLPMETSIQTPTPNPAALQVQAVLIAVTRQLSKCGKLSFPPDPPVVIIETRLEGPSVSFACRMSADTYYWVSIADSDREAIPAPQFTTEQANNGGKCFHGYVLYEEISQHPKRKYIRQHSQEWRTQHWIVSIKASYDYGYIHYAPQEFSEAIYTFGVAQGLFPEGTCP